jgi:UDP-N-acetyl-D-glucosamine dehydrogenase
LNTHRKPVNGSRVLVLGVAYKRDINDVRESPALGIMDQLLHKGADVSYHDPFVARMTLDGRGSLVGVPLDDEALTVSDCVVIVTDHSDSDYARVLKVAPLVIDTRNVTRRLNMPEYDQNVVRL